MEDGSSKTGGESKGSEKLPYVHVRARRGQATDSHSLAERVISNYYFHYHLIILIRY